MFQYLLDVDPHTNQAINVVQSNKNKLSKNYFYSRNPEKKRDTNLLLQKVTIVIIKCIFSQASITT